MFYTGVSKYVCLRTIISFLKELFLFFPHFGGGWVCRWSVTVCDSCWGEIFLFLFEEEDSVVFPKNGWILASPSLHWKSGSHAKTYENHNSVWCDYAVCVHVHAHTHTQLKAYLQTFYLLTTSKLMDLVADATQPLFFLSVGI